VKGERKTTRNIRTLGAVIDRRRVRTSGGALLELSALAHERTRLNNELRRMRNRNAEIEARQAEIACKENWLQSSVERPPGDVSTPMPVAESPSGLRVRELNY
jgi:hypothetical protein